MRQSRRRARTILVAAASAALLALAGVASAREASSRVTATGGPVTRITGNYFDYLDVGSEVHSGDVSQIGVECADNRPNGVGGGVLSTFGANPPALLRDSPDSGDAGWVVALAGTTPSTATFRAYGICTAAAVQTRSVSFGVPADGQAHTKTASCRAGYQVVSGGFDNITFVSHATIQRSVVQSYPTDGGDKDRTPDDGWRVTVRAAKKSAKPAEVYALCMKASEVQVIYEHLDFVARRQDVSGVYVDCNGLKEATGGGVQLDQPKSGIRLTNSAPVDSQNDSNSLPENRWVTTVDGPTHGHVDARNWAICTKVKQSALG